MIEPITPKAVKENATKPDEVIEAFNELIQRYWDGKQATFSQMEVARLIDKKLGNVGTKLVYENKYLDIEHIYEKAGWKVVYDKPGFNESYPSTYTFSQK